MYSIIATLFLVSTQAVSQQSLLNINSSFQTNNQSIWSSGNAFIWDYQKFVGPSANDTVVIGSGSKDKISAAGHSVNPYFQLNNNFRAGLDFGANINGGSINANLDYKFNLLAPDKIRIGDRFSLMSSIQKLSSSSFQTTATNASAFLDGVLDVSTGVYARFEVDRPILSDQDLRFGNKGFTNGNTSNRPYASLANIHERKELISINRNQSGVLKYLGGKDLSDGDLFYDSVGTGTTVSAGPVSFTAGNWQTNVTGTANNNILTGVAQETLITATLDVDHLIVGSPVLGLGVDHDWGLIDYDMGYDIVDYKANFNIGLSQEINLQDDVFVKLSFSEDVILDGIGQTNSYQGLFSLIPDITLLSTSVDVDSEFFLKAMLENKTDFIFDGSLDLVIFEAHLKANYDFLGLKKGKIIDKSLDPFYENSVLFDLGDITAFNDTFALNGFESVDGGQFTLSAVPVPASIWYFVSGLMMIYLKRRRVNG